MVSARLVLAWFVAATAVIASSISDAAHAQEALDLAWSAPASCPGRDVVFAEVRRLLGGRLRSEGLRLAVEAQVTASGGAYHLRIMTRDDGDERARTLSASTCEELADAAALIVALGLDPEAVAASGLAPPSASSPKASPPPSERPRAAPTAGSDARSPLPAPPPRTIAGSSGPPPASARPPSPRPPSPPARSEWALGIYAGATVDAGTFRDVTPIPRAGVTVAREDLRLEATALFAWAGRVSVPSASAKGGELWLAAASLSAGTGGIPRARGLSRDALRLAGSAGVELGVQGATSYGVSAPGHGEAPWIAPFGMVAVRWAIAGPLRLRIDAAMLLPIVRPEFVLTNVGSLQRVGPLLGRLAAGLEFDAAFF